MSSPCTCIERWALLALLLLSCLVLPAAGQSIERALMPGKVIEGHAKYEEDCKQCHQRFDRNAQTRLCADCHKEIGRDISAKKGFHGHLDEVRCAACHTEHKGRNARLVVFDKNGFDHDKTGYSLKGAHRELGTKCERCHGSSRPFREASPRCISCHRKDDDKKGHQGGLGEGCDKCHDESRWKNTRFDHDKTRFKLEGEHKTTACQDCHEAGKYKDTPRECINCHRQDDQKEGHHGRFGNRCQSCHTAVQWDNPSFDHGRETHYVLKGKHKDAECTACHTKPLYSVKLPTHCATCHGKDDEEKGHRGALGDKCETCHGEQGWKKTSFDHDKDTDYPLRDKHRDARCDACHTQGISVSHGRKGLEKLPRDCVGCHRKDDDKKGHQGHFGGKCETCHTTTGWKDSRFDHDRDTRYGLKGKHLRTACRDCHTGNLYQDKLETTCISCHEKDDRKLGHKGQLGKRCESCHHEGSWKVADFNHNRSRFPLLGLHRQVACSKCHSAATFHDAPRACNGCHEKDDVHKTRFGIRCETCHNPRSWQSWDFDHSSTGFRLDGGHRKVACADCHRLPKPKDSGTPTPVRSCVNCHDRDDVHNGGFGLQCEICHRSDDWRTVARRAR